MKTRLVLLVALLAAPLAASAVDVWTAVASEKIRPEATARSTRAVTVSAARNEFEAFQILVTGAAANVRATATDLTGPGGAIRDVRLYRQALINAPNASGLDTQAGRWPDALVPDVDELVGEKRNAFPFTVPAGESRGIWGEILVPADATPGAYTGTVTVTWDGGAATVPVTLTVWPFTLPSTASLKTAFGFTWGALNNEHGVSTSTSIAALRAMYNRFALDHRLSLSHIDDGAWDNLPHFASYYGPSIDGNAATRLPGAKMTAVEVMGDVYAWSPFFATKGWSDRLFSYTCDEPPLTCAWTDIPTRAARSRAASPPVRTLVTTTLQEATARGVLSSIDILVPVINYLDDKPGSGQFAGEQRAKYDTWLAGSPDREIWSYQSCMSHGCGGTVNFGNPSASDQYFTGWPAYEIDASAVRNRAMEWLSFRYRLSGELYYESVEAYGENPWNGQWAFSGNGDGTFFYPGKPSVVGGTKDIPVASIRLKMIREGMEDYEYLKILSDLGADAEARAIATRLFPHAYQTNQTADALMAARAEIAAAIVARVAPPAPPPDPQIPPTDPPTPPGDPQAPPTDDPTVPPITPDTGAEPGAPLTASTQGGCGSAGGFGVVALLGAAGALVRRRRRG